MSVRKHAAHALGIAAEKQAASYLQAKGYSILGERIRTQGGEMDVVASLGDTLVIVEVKARANYASALESITPAKQLKLTRAVEGLLADHEKMHGLDLSKTPNIRFDVVVVTPFGLHHMMDAWRPEYANI